MVIESGVFAGTLRHRRFTPVTHEFSYRVWMALLDIDRIPELMRVSRLTSWNRLNWVSFDDRDHLGDPSAPLRERVLADASKHDITVPEGPIFLLTNLRFLGYCFNPVSFFYCFDNAWALRRVLAEVNNTFGGSHTYWLRPDADARTFRSTAAKSLYVSPFMPVDLEYHFALTPPAHSLVAHMDTRRDGCVTFDATLALERRPWTAAAIARQLLRQPAMTASVIAAIHWQALQLWLKGTPHVPRTTRNGEGERAAWAVGGSTSDH